MKAIGLISGTLLIWLMACLAFYFEIGGGMVFTTLSIIIFLAIVLIPYSDSKMGKFYKGLVVSAAMSFVLFFVLGILFFFWVQGAFHGY